MPAGAGPDAAGQDPDRGLDRGPGKQPVAGQAPAPDLSGPELRVLARACRWPASPVLDLAVSGGPDSMALVVLARVAGKTARAHHVDHGLRPGSGDEAEAVGWAVRRLGASFTSTRVDVPPGPNLEARARALRYAALPTGVLTGHTADDQAETVLLNVLRGAALDGLAPMTATVTTRPLLGLRRSDTARACRLAGIVALSDPSNADLSLRRNAVRHRLMPLIAELGQRDPVPILARQAALLAEDAELLEGLAAELDPTDARALAAAPVALARRAVRAWLRAGSDAEHHPPSAVEVERVLAVARGDAVGTELAGGRRVRRSRGILYLIPSPHQRSAP